MFAKRLTPLLLLLALSGCEPVATLLDLPDPKKEAELAEAEGKAIGGACRQSGRPLEDCYQLNPKAKKAAIYSGWREMNDYMMQNNLETVPSQLSQPGRSPAAPAQTKDADTPVRESGDGRSRRPATAS